MPRNINIKKVLVIGSGPIIIGQAAEFDYAGTQACRALKEEGIEVVLVNSNPATIMTDVNMADKVYLEPLNVSTLKNIILKEQPDSILPTLGGQTGLNLAMELAEQGFLDRNNIRLLGTSMDTINKAEDREAFQHTMEKINQPIIEGIIAHNIETTINFAKNIGYPVVVRPAYTLGGTGGGIAQDENELIEIASDGLRLSRVHQILVEKSVAGWKEIEFEVIRDRKGNCMSICSMENIDPVGIHTGDSIVVAPAQTLNTLEYEMLRTAALKIINELKIEGGCNVQFALDPCSMDYYVIEVNPRVSRSSALASKATGYPIARITAKIAVGYTLDEMLHGISKNGHIISEPIVDYIVVKIPKWPFDKFVKADKRLGTKMKATGEVMAIGSSIEEGLLKAIRSLELGIDSLDAPRLKNFTDAEIKNRLHEKTDERIFIVGEALRRGVDIDMVYRYTAIDKFFIGKIYNIVKMEEALKNCDVLSLKADILLKAKEMGFTDNTIARFTDTKEQHIYNIRENFHIYPVYRKVDTYAKHLKSGAPYYYSTYLGQDEMDVSNNKKVVVLGSGPIRIGQGIEFDYCSVHAVWALKEIGFETIIINNNPETVSTDFDTADKLYFEPLTPEDVINILEREKPLGVMVQFGGQTAIKLVDTLYQAGYKILGTHPKAINQAEDRKEFDMLLNKLNIKRPKGATVFTTSQAINAAEKLGYPVLIRPSYVLGGQGMQIAHSSDDIEEYMGIINRTKQDHPILIDKYLIGKEIEIDAVCDGEDILIPGIMQHIERAGVHSGDSISVYPQQSLSKATVDKIVEYTKKIAAELKVKGLINIQFVEYNNEVYIIEVNPRSSRTIPYISKVTGIPMVNLATRAMMDYTIKQLGYGIGLAPKRNIVAVKVPVFSFEKLPQVETSLGPEMKSTGEVLGIGKNLSEALYKGLIAAGYNFAKTGTVLITVAEHDKQEVIPLAAELEKLGFDILATGGTAHVLISNYIAANVVNRISESHPNIEDFIEQGKIQMIINTPTKGRIPQRDGFKIRRKGVEYGIPCFTSLDTAKAFINSIKLSLSGEEMHTISLQQLEDMR